jgi:hypothetical protein
MNARGLIMNMELIENQRQGEVIMIEDTEEKSAAVICLHCGQHTPLPLPANRERFAGRFAVSYRRLSIVRCFICGKEAPYLASDVIVPAEFPVNVSAAA